MGRRWSTESASYKCGAADLTRADPRKSKSSNVCKSGKSMKKEQQQHHAFAQLHKDSAQTEAGGSFRMLLRSDVFPTPEYTRSEQLLRVPCSERGPCL